jgi:hypothetical protein
MPSVQEQGQAAAATPKGFTQLFVVPDIHQAGALYEEVEVYTFPGTAE